MKEIKKIDKKQTYNGENKDIWFFEINKVNNF